MEPHGQESKQRYDSWHQAMADEERRETAPPIHPWHVTKVKLLPDLNSCDVLEVGCGRGDFTKELARRFRRNRAALSIGATGLKALGTTYPFLLSSRKLARPLDLTASC